MQLFAFGSNGSGQLGIGHDKDVSVPTLCKFKDYREREVTLRSGIARIVAGGNHTLVHLENGKVYSTGKNDDGQCAHNQLDNELMLTFNQVIIQDVSSGMLYETFKHVAATWEASFLVTKESWDDAEEAMVENVYVTGIGTKGELGIGSKEVTAPLRIPMFPDLDTTVVAISGGLSHVVAVLSNGEAWGWGTSRKGQLGNSCAQESIVWQPSQIEGVPFQVTDVTCGREFTVLMGNKDAGEFMILGAAGDKWGIVSGAPSPSDIAGYLSIQASWHNAYVHRRDLSILAWGRNDHGQLPPADLQRAQKISAGSEHAIALCESGQVIAFGWGEHGNCGAVVTGERGKVMARFALQPAGASAVLGVWAGCATSFVLFS